MRASPLDAAAVLAVQAPAAIDGASGAAQPVQMRADVLFHLFGLLPVTNTLLMTWVVMAVLVLFALLTTRRLRERPSGFQNFWELLCETWIKVVDRSVGPRGRRFVPLLGASFLFILLANWLSTLPFKHLKVEGANGYAVELFRPPMADLNLTVAMAVLVIVLVEAVEMRAVGVRRYFRSLVLPNPLRTLEFVTRPLSLALRLFGNIFAGEILVGAMLVVAPVVLFAFLGLELFVGLIQALIFSVLTLVFLSVALIHEDAHGAEDRHDDERHADERAPSGAAADAARHADQHRGRPAGAGAPVAAA